MLQELLFAYAMMCWAVALDSKKMFFSHARYALVVKMYILNWKA